MKQNLFPTIACPLPLQQNPAQDTFSQCLPRVWDCARCPETKNQGTALAFVGSWPTCLISWMKGTHRIWLEEAGEPGRGRFQEQMSHATAQRQGTTSWVALLRCRFKAEIITRDGMERKFQNMDAGGRWGLDSELGM